MISRSKHNRLPVVEHGRLRRRGHPRRRARGPLAGVAVLRALARIDLAAIERNCALLARRAGAGARCARWSRPTATGTARCRPRARRRRAARRGSRSPRRTRRRELRAAGDRRAAPGHGRAVGGRADVALRRRRRRRRLARGLRRRARRASATPTAPACTSSSTPAWAGSGRATRRRRRAPPRPSRPRRGSAGRRDDALRHRRRRPGVRPRAARALPALGRSRCEAAHGPLLLHAANSAATLGIPESRLDMVRCGIAVYGHGPVRRRTRRATGSTPALELRSYLAEVKPIAAGGERGLRPPLRRRGADARSGRSRSATPTACAARSPTTATC